MRVHNLYIATANRETGQTFTSELEMAEAMREFLIEAHKERIDPDDALPDVSDLTLSDLERELLLEGVEAFHWSVEVGC